MCTPISENTLIFTHDFDHVVQVSFEENLKVGNLTFSDYHRPDCCENVYADFSIFEFYAAQLNKDGIIRLEVKAVEDMGIIFFFYAKSAHGETPLRTGVLVNCYNSQNGYYSSDLQLIISDGVLEQKIDVSEVVYDLIY